MSDPEPGLSGLDVGVALAQGAAAGLAAWVALICLLPADDWALAVVRSVPFLNDQDQVQLMWAGGCCLSGFVGVLAWRSRRPPLRRLTTQGSIGLVALVILVAGMWRVLFMILA